MEQTLRTINIKLKKHPESRKVLIMGGGPVGLYLANYILSRNLLRPDDTYHVVLIDKRFSQIRDQVVIIQNDIIDTVLPAHATPLGYYFQGNLPQDWIARNGEHRIINDELLEELIKYSCHQFDAPLHLRTIDGSIRTSMANTAQELQEYSYVSSDIISERPYTADQTGCKIPYNDIEYYKRIGSTGIPGGLTIPINKLQYLLTTLNLKDKYTEWYTFVLMDKDREVYESFMKSLTELNFDIVHCAIGSPENIVSPRGTRRTELPVLDYVFGIQYFYNNIVKDKHSVKYQKVDGSEVDCWGQVCQIKLKEHSEAGKEFTGILLNSQNVSKSFGCANSDSCTWIKSAFRVNNVQNKHRLFAKRNKNLSKKLEQDSITTNSDDIPIDSKIIINIKFIKDNVSLTTINENNTISELSEEIEKKMGIKKTNQRLFWNNIELNDIKSDTTINTILTSVIGDYNNYSMNITMFTKDKSEIIINISEPNTKSYHMVFNQGNTISDLIDEIEKKTKVKKDKQILYWNGIRISDAFEATPTIPIYSITNFDENFDGTMDLHLFRKGLDGLNIDLIDESITSDYDLYLGLVLTNNYDPKNSEHYSYIVMHIILALERMGIPYDEIDKIANISNPFPIDKYNPDLDLLPYPNIRDGGSDLFSSNNSSIVYPIGDTLYPHHFFSGAGVGRGFVASAYAFESCVRLDNTIKENSDPLNTNRAPVTYPFKPEYSLSGHPNQYALLEIEEFRKVIRNVYRAADQATINVSTENRAVEELEKEFQRVWSSRGTWPRNLIESFQEIISKSFKERGRLKNKKSTRKKKKKKYSKRINSKYKRRPKGKSKGKPKGKSKGKPKDKSKDKSR